MTVAIGFFDGVHLGHQAILKGADMALTFENHPLSVLAPDRAPRLIMSLEDRVATIKSCGVKRVEALKFDQYLAELSPEDFLRLLKDLSGSDEDLRIRSGANWHFGKGGVGDAAWLNAHGITASVIPYAEYKEEIVSSTRIRRVLEAGEIEDANEMMGRELQIRGVRFKGKGEGYDIGYPTINLRPLISSLKLPLGVYETRIDGVRAIANYGHAPTFGDKAWDVPVWELHLLSSESSETISKVGYGAKSAFSLLRFIRGERKFDSIDELKRQIAADIALIA